MVRKNRLKWKAKQQKVATPCGCSPFLFIIYLSTYTLSLSLSLYLSFLFHSNSLILFLPLSLSLSLALTLHFSFLPLMHFLIDKETGKKDWERNAPPPLPPPVADISYVSESRNGRAESQRGESRHRPIGGGITSFLFLLCLLSFFFLFL